jgi:dTDP-4-dehydrorhamnose 3,5-epimerase
MHIERTAIDGVLIVRPRKIADARGFFSETFKHSALAEAGADVEWVQDNHTLSVRRGVVRGLHFQAPPHAQAKLIRVTRGAIFDVAVDIRRGSATYGQHLAIELSAENWTQAFIPAGFAHGYCALTDNTEVHYKVSAEHAPAEEGGLLWDDPDLAIAWPIGASEATLSLRDRTWPRFKDFVSPF